MILMFTEDHRVMRNSGSQNLCSHAVVKARGMKWPRHLQWVIVCGDVCIEILEYGEYGLFECLLFVCGNSKLHEFPASPSYLVFSNPPL